MYYYGINYLTQIKILFFIARPTQIPSLFGVEGVSHGSASPSPGSSMTEPPTRQSASSTTPPSQPIELWVERAPSVPSVELTTNRAPFDVYIDEVRFIPDNATVVKVYRIIHSP